MASVVVLSDDYRDQVRVSWAIYGCSSLDQTFFGSKMRCSTTNIDTNCDEEAEASLEREFGQFCENFCVERDNCNTETFPKYKLIRDESEQYPPVKIYQLVYLRQI